MAAFKASRLVCRAISSMILILSAISRMAVTASDTASPPSSACLAAPSARVCVWAAFSAFWLILEAISSMLEETSSMEAACSVAPCDSAMEVEESSSEPEATLLVTPRTSPTTLLRFAPISASVEAMTPISSFWLISSCAMRLPAAISLANSTALIRELVMALASRTTTTTTRRIAAMVKITLNCRNASASSYILSLGMAIPMDHGEPVPFTRIGCNSKRYSMLSSGDTIKPSNFLPFSSEERIVVFNSGGKASVIFFPTILLFGWATQ